MTDAVWELWDWRTRIATLYAAIRANPDPEAAWQHWRDTRDALFQTHPQTPLEGPPQPLPYYPYDPALRFLVTLDPIPDAAEEPLPAGADGDVRLKPFARTRGLPLGGELTLYWLQGYGGGVFLPFADAMRGIETYGAGRYLLDTIKGADLGQADGQAVLDFNFAYNPSCAYSSRYICPLAPTANRLHVPVRAGEKAPISM